MAKDPGVFVPKLGWPSVHAKAQGPRKPSVSNPGGSIQMVLRGPAYGGVGSRDGGQMNDRIHMKKSPPVAKKMKVT